MIKIRKVDFNGYGIDYIPKNIDLRAIGLIKYRWVNDDAFQTGEPIILDIFSKISVVDGDFSVKDIVTESDVELAVCACNDHSVIYCEKRKDWIFKSISSENEYIAHSNNIFYKCYGDVFVVEEDDDYGSKKVIAFDMDLNIISSSIMESSDLNEYEINELNNQSDNITTDNTLVFENRSYALNFTDRSGKKWRLTEFANDGEPVDNYDFKGVDAVLTLYNNKPVIVYKDLSALTPHQKMIYRKTGELICPAAMIIVD